MSHLVRIRCTPFMGRRRTVLVGKERPSSDVVLKARGRSCRVRVKVLQRVLRGYKISAIGQLSTGRCLARGAAGLYDICRFLTFAAVAFHPQRHSGPH